MLHNIQQHSVASQYASLLMALLDRLIIEDLHSAIVETCYLLIHLSNKRNINSREITDILRRLDDMQALQTVPIFTRE